MPLDPREQPILDSLMKVRVELTLLKQDRSTYIKSSDVLAFYDRVVEQVKILNEIRADKPHEDNRGQFGRQHAATELIVVPYS